MRGPVAEEKCMTEVAQALRDKTAIVGVGLKMGKYPDSTALELATQCYQIGRAHV